MQGSPLTCDPLPWIKEELPYKNSIHLPFLLLWDIITGYQRAHLLIANKRINSVDNSSSSIPLWFAESTWAFQNRMLSTYQLYVWTFQFRNPALRLKDRQIAEDLQTKAAAFNPEKKELRWNCPLKLVLLWMGIKDKLRDHVIQVFLFYYWSNEMEEELKVQFALRTVYYYDFRNHGQWTS